MTIIADYTLGLTVRETLDVNVPAASQVTVIHSKFNSNGTLNATTTPPVAKVAAFQKALVAGAGTIDLTALVGTGGAAVDGTGLKIQAIKVQNPSTNVNPLIIQPGGVNPYNLFGAAFKITLHPGKEFVWVSGKDADTPDVAAGAKTLGLTDGVAGTETSNWIIVLG